MASLPPPPSGMMWAYDPGSGNPYLASASSAIPSNGVLKQMPGGSTPSSPSPTQTGSSPMPAAPYSGSLSSMDGGSGADTRTLGGGSMASLAAAASSGGAGGRSGAGPGGDPMMGFGGDATMNDDEKELGGPESLRQGIGNRLPPKYGASLQSLARYAF